MLFCALGIVQSTVIPPSTRDTMYKRTVAVYACGPRYTLGSLSAALGNKRSLSRSRTQEDCEERFGHGSKIRKRVGLRSNRVVSFPHPPPPPLFTTPTPPLSTLPTSPLYIRASSRVAKAYKSSLRFNNLCTQP